MNRKIATKLIAAFSFLAAALFWLLSVLLPEQFGAFNIAWAGFVFAGINGVSFLVNAIVTRRSASYKHLFLIAAGVLFLIAVLCLALAIAIPGHIVVPIIAVALAFVLTLGVFAVGDRKWDEGDNQKEGYRSYRQRKQDQPPRGKDGE